MTKRLRDNQRSKGYGWERTLENWEGVETMTLKEIKKLVTKVARDYGLSHRKVAVLDGRGRRSACYDSGVRAIRMPTWARNRMVALHELAHWIEWVRWPEKTAAHGREFMGIYMELLRRYDGHAMSDLVASANAARVDFMANSTSTARYLKQHGMRA